MKPKAIEHKRRRKIIRKYFHDEFLGLLDCDQRLPYGTTKTKQIKYSEAALLYKLNRAFILKDASIIAPHLSEEFTINGLKPPLMVGKNHKDLLLAQIRAIEDSRGSTNWFFFKSDYIKLMYRDKEKWALSTTYTIQKEPMFTLSIHVKLKDGKIDTLYNRFIDKPTDDFCKLICTWNQKPEDIEKSYLESLKGFK